MALLTPRLFRRGLEIFAAISVLGFVGLLLYGNNLERFLDALVSVHFGWVLVGVGLASLDWFGGGLRLFVVARHLYRRQTLSGAILAGGLNTWASYLTPSQTGGGPMMMYTLKRYGTPLPEAMVSSLVTFMATIVFLGVAGPLAIFLGAGRSLARHGVIGDAIDLYDLFRLSLAGFVAVGLLTMALILFPRFAQLLARRVGGWLERRGKSAWATRVAGLEAGADQAHKALLRFAGPRGWLAIGASVLLSAAAHANKLLAGFVVLKMLGISAPFVDVLLLQTLITFVLYFAPTPGGSGLAELLSAAVMSIYVPRALTPSYILLWRLMVCYLTVGFGSVIFWRWLKGAEAKDALLEAS